MKLLDKVLSLLDNMKENSYTTEGIGSKLFELKNGDTVAVLLSRKVVHGIFKELKDKSVILYGDKKIPIRKVVNVRMR